MHTKEERDGFREVDSENLNPNAYYQDSDQGYEETPTGYDLTLRKVVQERPVLGLDKNLNVIHGAAPIGMCRKFMFEGQIPNSLDVRRQLNQMKGAPNMKAEAKESFYNRTLLERQAIELHQNMQSEEPYRCNGDLEGTPDWSLNLPETQFQLPNFQIDCVKDRGQSVGYFKPKASILGEQTRISEIIAEPTHI